MSKLLNTLPEKGYDKRELSREEVGALSPPASPQRGGQPKYTPLTWAEVGRSPLPLPKYTPLTWAEVGRSLLLAAL